MRDSNWDDQLIQKYIAFFKDTTITASSKICDSLKSHCASVYLDELDYAGKLLFYDFLKLILRWSI